MLKEKGLKSDRPIEQYVALAIQPAMMGTFKKEDIKTNIDHITDSINPNVAKIGGLQSQGAKVEAVVGYCEALATPDLKPSGFPEG